MVHLTQKVASSAHIEFHARIILQKYIQRSSIRISNEIMNLHIRNLLMFWIYWMRRSLSCMMLRRETSKNPLIPRKIL